MNSYRLPLLVESKKALLALVLMAVWFGCKPGNGSSREEAMPLSIQNTGGVKVIAYCYPSSTHTDQIYAEKREFLDRKIRDFSDQIAKQPAYLQASSRKILELLDHERRLMGASNNWTVVYVEQVLLAEEKPSRYLAILRNANRPLDVVLVIRSDEQMDGLKAFDLVQSAISRLESLSDEDWKKFKPGREEVFAPDGNLKPPELQRVAEGAGFVGPPN